MAEAYIVDYLRTPFAPAYRGALAPVRPDDLAASVIAALVARAGFPADEIEDVNLGCAFPEGEQGLNIARCAALTAGLPQSVGGSTVNRWCGSSMQAIQMAAGAIAMGAGDAFIAGGVESMSRVPMMGFNPQPNPGWTDAQRLVFLNMGLTAETLAERYCLSREEQDAYSLESQKKSAGGAGGRQAGCRDIPGRRYRFRWLSAGNGCGEACRIEDGVQGRRLRYRWQLVPAHRRRLRDARLLR